MPVFMRRTAPALVLTFCLCISFGCPGELDGEDEEDRWLGGGNPTDPPFRVTYDPNSFFNQRISKKAEVDPNSAAMIQRLAGLVASKDNMILLTQEYTYPVYFVDASTPTYDVQVTASWRPSVNGQKVNYLVNVPIPTGARPDPVPIPPPDDGDADMVIIDTVNGYEYDLWQMQATKKGWRASWGNRISYQGDGIYPGGYSAKGSGFAVLAGAIWPEELQAGVIKHKLFCSVDPKANSAAGPVPPATESDGRSNHPDAIPEGAVLQLDPSLDLNEPALGLTPIEKIIARAMQEYGLVNGDNNGGGSIDVYAVHPFSFRQNPYPPLMQNEDVWNGYVFMRNIPVDRLQVLKLPPIYDPPAFLADETIYR